MYRTRSGSHYVVNKWKLSLQNVSVADAKAAQEKNLTVASDWPFVFF